MRPPETDPKGTPTRGLVPLLDLLGIVPIEVGEGRARVELVVSGEHLRTKGIAHGGLSATLLDTAMGWAAGSRAPDGMDVVTAQLNVNFIRPAKAEESLIAVGQVQHAGRRTAVARGEIHTADGQLVATGSATFLYIRLDHA